MSKRCTLLTVLVGVLTRGAAISDEETFAEITTLESGEYAFVSQQGNLQIGRIHLEYRHSKLGLKVEL